MEAETTVGSSSLPRRSRAANKALRRRQIINATIESIAKRGFAETTIATVAEEAGVSQGILIFHFKTKDALLVATLSFLAEEYRESWRGALEKAPDDPVARIIALIVTDFHPRICTRKKLAVWHAFYGEAKSRPTYLRICGERDLERSQLMQELCAVALAREAPGGPWNAERAAASLEGLSDGLWQQLLLSAKTIDRAWALGVMLTQLRSILPNSMEEGI